VLSKELSGRCHSTIRWLSDDLVTRGGDLVTRAVTLTQPSAG
jgi:hypothetical protein